LKVKACCPTCNVVLWQGQVDTLDAPDETLAEQSDDESDTAKRRRRKKKNKTEEDWQVGDDNNLIQPKMKDRSKWITRYDKNFPEQQLLASAKTIAVKNQILVWQKAAPDDKIIGKTKGKVYFPSFH
jgi:hypothetical protein